MSDARPTARGHLTQPFYVVWWQCPRCGQINRGLFEWPDVSAMLRGSYVGDECSNCHKVTSVGDPEVTR